MLSRPRQATTVHLSLLVCAALGAGGCTIAGFGIGSVVDSKRAKLKPAPTSRLAAVRPGTRIALHLADGRRLEGELAGTRLREPKEYASAYETARASRPSEVDLPELGPCVLKEVGAGPARDVEWVGLDLAGIVVRSAGRPATIPFERVGALRDPHGRVVSGPALQQLAEAQRVPLLSAVVLRGVDEPLPAERIVQIEAPKPGKRNGKLIGTLTGLAIDAVVIAIASQAGQDLDVFACDTVSASQGCTSCPFALSFDGARYVRDAEVLGSATLEAAQHTDRAPLAHIAEVDGAYRLRVANELREVDAIDAVRLVIADAPRGVRVVASSDGRLVALASPVAPRSVLDLRGRDVTRLVREPDGVVWLGSPWGRDPARASDLRDGFVMDFERPADADTATLAFRLRSTAWAPQLLTEALALHGPDLPDWRARMNVDAGARAAFLGALRREVLPSISIWDGGAWRPVGVLSNLGPWLDRDQALRVSLNGLPGPTLRVRLDSTPGLWIVDSAQADFALEPPIDVHVSLPRRADFEGRDVRGALREPDGDRVSLDQGQSIELAFVAPASREDRSRTVFVEATGYYTPLVPLDGDPRPDLFERLVHEPGAVARWSLERFAHELALARPRGAR